MTQVPNGLHEASAGNGKLSYAERHKIASHFIGGNCLENAETSKVKDFVAAHDGHTVITNVCLNVPLSKHQKLCH